MLKAIFHNQILINAQTKVNTESPPKFHLGDHSEVKIVEGATHLFEEPGKLDEVIKLAEDWFSRYLPS